MEYVQETFGFADQHNGAAMIFLTLVYVVASLIMAIAMFKANTLSTRAILTTEKLEMERKRPYVVFDIELRGNNFFYVLRNIGLTQAKNVRAQIDPKPISGLQPLGNAAFNVFPAFLSSEIPSLAPSRALEALLGDGPSFYRDNTITAHTASISYEDVFGNHYNETSVVDLALVRNTAVPQPIQQKILETLNKIEKALSSNTQKS